MLMVKNIQRSRLRRFNHHFHRWDWCCESVNGRTSSVQSRKYVKALSLHNTFLCRLLISGARSLVRLWSLHHEVVVEVEQPVVDGCKLVETLFIKVITPTLVKNLFIRN